MNTATVTFYGSSNTLRTWADDVEAATGKKCSDPKRSWFGRPSVKLRGATADDRAPLVALYNRSGWKSAITFKVRRS